MDKDKINGKYIDHWKENAIIIIIKIDSAILADCNLALNIYKNENQSNNYECIVLSKKINTAGYIGSHFLFRIQKLNKLNNGK